VRSCRADPSAARMPCVNANRFGFLSRTVKGDGLA
jgi:hypothetical protein